MESPQPYTFEELCDMDAGHHLGADEAMQAMILRTMARLPGDVQDFACHQLRFVSIGDEFNGLTFPFSDLAVLPTLIDRNTPEQFEPEAQWSLPPTERLWLIVLNDNILRNEPEEAQSTIAHEIAHAWLGHDTRPHGAAAAADFDGELAARTQARQWGFTGAAAHP